MTEQLLSIKTRNLDRIKKMIDDLPRKIRGEATYEAARYVVGNERRGLQNYPPRVYHDADNPYQWESEKQRRAYFATNGFGRGIPYERTYDLRFGWAAIKDGVQSKAANHLPYAGYVMGDKAQQRGHKADGWRTVSDIISTNTAGMMQAVNQFVKRWLKNNEAK